MEEMPLASSVSIARFKKITEVSEYIEIRNKIIKEIKKDFIEGNSVSKSYPFYENETSRTVEFLECELKILASELRDKGWSAWVEWQFIEASEKECPTLMVELKNTLEIKGEIFIVG